MFAATASREAVADRPRRALHRQHGEQPSSSVIVVMKAKWEQLAAVKAFEAGLKPVISKQSRRGVALGNKSRGGNLPISTKPREQAK